MRPGEANEWSGGRFSPEGSEEMGTFPTDTSSPNRVADDRGDRTAAVLCSLTGSRPHHDIDPFGSTTSSADYFPNPQVGSTN